MADQFLRAASPRSEQAAAPGGATLDLATAQANGRLYLETVAPGAATAEVWLHNGGPTTWARYVCAAATCSAHDGT